MATNFKTKIFILILFLLGALILYYSFQSKSPSPPITEEQRMQALIDLTTAPATSTPYSAEKLKELKKLVDLTTAPAPKK